MRRDLWDPHILCRECDERGCAYPQPSIYLLFLLVFVRGSWQPAWVVFDGQEIRTCKLQQLKLVTRDPTMRAPAS
jgi:hypothetical protein